MYHLHARAIGRKRKRRSVAVRAAAYRARDTLYDEVARKWVDHSHRQDLSASFILAPSGSPSWVLDRSRLWNSVEKNENRVDSQVCRELEISLPRVFDKDRSVRVIKDFVTENCVNLGMIADVSIHGVGSKNPHAHVLLTMRKLGPDESWGKKETDWNKRSLVNALRKDWENAYNREVKSMGMPQLTVSCESYRTRRLDKNPQKYCGARRIRLWREEQIIEQPSAQYVIDQLRKEEEELQREIEFLRMRERRVKRKSKQMLNQSLTLLSLGNVNPVVPASNSEPFKSTSVVPATAEQNMEASICLDGFKSRLAAMDARGVEQKQPGPGVAGPGFG